MPFRFLFFALSSLLLFAGCATAPGPVPYTVRSDIYYTSDRNSRQQGDLYLPRKQEGQVSPVVIVVHGGGWTGGSKEDMFMISKSLVSHGIAVYSINYRLAPKHLYPAGLKDLEKAYDFITSKAGEYGLDKNNIGLWGYSAGGHMVSLFALKSSKGNVRQRRPIKAVVSGGGPYDLTWYPHSPYANKYFGGYRDQKKKEYIDASPATHVHKKAPAFFLYHAIKDKLVVHPQAASFEFKLKQIGIEAHRYDVGYWSHVGTMVYSHQANRAGVEFLLGKFKHQ